MVMRRGLTIALTACLLALLVSAMGATRAGAASLQETGCAGQAQGGTTGGANEQGTTAGGTAGACAGGSSTAAMTAAYDGATCTIELPAGAAPGATVVVTQLPAETGGQPGANCRIEIVDPATAGGTTATGATAQTSPSCVVLEPATNGTFEVVPAGETGAAGGTTQVVESAPVEITGSAGACVVEFEPANAAGAQVVPAGGTLTCTVISGSISGAGAGQVGVGQGVTLQCDGIVPGISSGSGQAAACSIDGKVVTDPAACPTQP
jgi:hypothetical protein